MKNFGGESCGKMMVGGRNVSGLCLAVGCGISGVEPLGSATRELVN